MSKGMIAYVGEFAFPEGTASASRVLNIARIIRECGYDVCFFGQQHATSKKYKSKGYYDGFMYSNNSYVGKTKFQNVLSFYTRGFDLCKALDGIENLSAVITYGGYTLNAIPLLKYCRKKEIPIFADVVEWFSYQTFKYGYLSFKTLNVHYAMTNVYTKFDGIIVISSYLENYYRLHGMQTIKIPPVVNLQDEKWLVKSYKKNEKLRICYAGVPGKKDYIQNVILAINELDDYSKSNIEFHLYGPTVSQIEKCLGKNAGVLNNIKSIVGAALFLADKLDVTYHRTENSSINDEINNEIKKIRKVNIDFKGNEMIISYTTDQTFNPKILCNWKKAITAPIKVAKYLNKEVRFLLNNDDLDISEI